MTNLKKRLELARLLKMFSEAVAEDGTLFVWEGELQEGLEVYTTGEDGGLVAVKDGEYTLEGKTVEVKDGKVSVITVKEETIETEDTYVEEVKAEVEEEEEKMETVEEVIENNEMDELRARIAELEIAVSEKDARIAELEAELVKANEATEEPIEDKFTKVEEEEKFNLREYVRKVKNK